MGAAVLPIQNGVNFESLLIDNDICVVTVVENKLWGCRGALELDLVQARTCQHDKTKPRFPNSHA
jgi:hypothetical protein